MIIFCHRVAPFFLLLFFTHFVLFSLIFKDRDNVCIIIFTFKWENFSFVLFFFDFFIHIGNKKCVFVCGFFLCQNRIGETCENYVLFYDYVWMNDWMKAYIINISYMYDMKRNRKFWAIFTVTEILFVFLSLEI